MGTDRFAHVRRLPPPGVARAYALAAAGLALVWGGLLLWLSWQRYLGFNAAMYDLGNMAQAIASVLRGQPLVVTFPDGPLSRLAMHVELGYLLLAPLWALWPDPRMLLLVQTALYTAGAWPAYRLGTRAAAHPLGGLSLMLIYLFYPVALTALLFDFHGDTLAMPLLLFALEALDRRAWGQYALWIALALSFKFYVALPVAMLGLLLVWQPATRRVGLLTTGAALGYGLLAFLVIRPLFTTATTAASHRGWNYLGTYFGQFEQVFATAPARLITAAIIFSPLLLLLRGGWPWLLPALPVALAALLSSGPGGSFDYRYHHYATVVPFLVMAAAVGLATARMAPYRPGARSWRNDMLFTALLVVLLSALLVDIPLNPRFWLAPPGMGRDPSAYGRTERDAVMRDFLAAHVPPEAPLAASTFLASHLVERETLYLTRYADDPGAERLPQLLPQVDYVLSDALFDWRRISGTQVFGGPDYERLAIGVMLADPAFGLVQARDGLLLFQRDPAPGLALSQQFERRSATTLPPLNADLGPLRLLGAEVRPLGGRGAYQASFAWTLDAPLSGTAPIAVSTLDGVAGARMVHLPTFAMLPATSWRPGEVIQEQFEVELPDDLPPGSFTWRVALYDPAHPEAYATDERSQLGPSVVITTSRD